MRGLVSCRLVRQDLAQPDPPPAHRVFVLSGKRGGTRAGCAHGMEAQQPGGSPGVGGSVFPPGEQAPLSLWGQHTPLSASWKTCRFGQGLSSATSSCLAPPAAGRRPGTGDCGPALSGLRVSRQSSTRSGVHPDGCVPTCQPLSLPGPGRLVASWTCRHSGTSSSCGPTAWALWEGRAQLPWRCVHAAGA